MAGTIAVAANRCESRHRCPTRRSSRRFIFRPSCLHPTRLSVNQVVRCPVRQHEARVPTTSTRAATLRRIPLGIRERSRHASGAAEHGRAQRLPQAHHPDVAFIGLLRSKGSCRASKGPPFEGDDLLRREHARFLRPLRRRSTPSNGRRLIRSASPAHSFDSKRQPSTIRPGFFIPDVWNRAGDFGVFLNPRGCRDRIGFSLYVGAAHQRLRAGSL
jgi:hypothetical protein